MPPPKHTTPQRLHNKPFVTTYDNQSESKEEENYVSRMERIRGQSYIATRALREDQQRGRGCRLPRLNNDNDW